MCDDEFVIFLISVEYKAQMGLTTTDVMMTNSEVWVVMLLFHKDWGTERRVLTEMLIS